MTAIEIILIIVGVVFMVGSFFVTEKLSAGELEKIAQLSENEIKIIAERELKTASERIVEQAERTVKASSEVIERALAKEANEKIMAIGEYSDTVIENMNRTHNEIMFLYGMLNDRHAELTELTGEAAAAAGELQKAYGQTKQDMLEREILTGNVNYVPQEQPAEEQKLTQPEKQQQTKQTEEAANHNERILKLYQEGKSCMDIAKELQLGYGEVKLVIDLFKGEK